jgi:hypothetical protein
LDDPDCVVGEAREEECASVQLLHYDSVHTSPTRPPRLSPGLPLSLKKARFNSGRSRILARGSSREWGERPFPPRIATILTSSESRHPSHSIHPHLRSPTPSNPPSPLSLSPMLSHKPLDSGPLILIHESLASTHGLYTSILPASAHQTSSVALKPASSPVLRARILLRRDRPRSTIPASPPRRDRARSASSHPLAPTTAIRRGERGRRRM